MSLAPKPINNPEHLLEEETVEEYLEEVEDITGLSATEAFDEIKINNIPDPNEKYKTTPARTQYQPTLLDQYLSQGNESGKTTLELDPWDIQNFRDDEFLNVLTHEVEHALDFKGKLDKELEENLGLERDTVKQLSQARQKNEDLNEGIIQKTANQLISRESGQIFRQEETAQAENYLEQQGIDLEEEIDPYDLPVPEDQGYQGLSREINNQFVGDNVYLETGEVDGLNYTFLYTGEQAEEADELVEDYLEQLGQLVSGDPLQDSPYSSIRDYDQGLGYGMVDNEEEIDGSVSMDDVDETLSPVEETV